MPMNIKHPLIKTILIFLIKRVHRLGEISLSIFSKNTAEQRIIYAARIEIQHKKVSPQDAPKEKLGIFLIGDFEVQGSTGCDQAISQILLSGEQKTSRDASMCDRSESRSSDQEVSKRRSKIYLPCLSIFL
jgi:hypothetical protein